MVFLVVLFCSCCFAFNKTAYYIVWDAQVQDSSFPQPHVSGKDVYVIQPANFTFSSVSKLRNVANANAIVLLYLDFINIPVLAGCSTGHVMGDKSSPPRQCETKQQPFYM